MNIYQRYDILLEKKRELERTVQFIVNQIELAIEHIENDNSILAKLTLFDALRDKRFHYK